MRRMGFLAIALVVVWTLAGQAAVKTEEKTQVQFGGALGRMMGMFGGKASKEGITEMVAVKGDRKLTRSGDTGQIIDLNEEKVYEVDFKGKSYKVTTFAEMRQQMQEAYEKMQKEMEKMKDAPPPQTPEGPPQVPPNQMEVDFDLKESGQRKNISGFDCREMVMTIGLHEKGKKLEDAGGMLVTSHIWLAPEVAALKEIAEFDLRYFQKLAPPVNMADLEQMQQMAAVMMANPMLKEGMGKLAEESEKLEGTALLTTTTMEGVQSKEQMAQQAQAQKEEESTTNIPIGGDKKSAVGGLLGGLAGRMARRAAAPKEEATQTPGRSTIMTTTTELLKISSDVKDADLALSPGFKEKK